MSLHNAIHLLARDNIIAEIKNDYHRKYNDVATRKYIETQLNTKLVLKKIFQEELRIILQFFDEQICWNKIIVLLKLIQYHFIGYVTIVGILIALCYIAFQHYHDLSDFISNFPLTK